LAACRKPISEKNLKIVVHLPAELFQKSLTLLLEKHWLESSNMDDSGLVHYVTKAKGAVFLDKYLKLQHYYFRTYTRTNCNSQAF
jgi:hypothetical protein